jgi:hypothetical protein
MVTSMTEQPGPHDPAERRAADRQGRAADRQAADRHASDRRNQGVDVFGELQRWFIRQSAKNMRREISGQVRRTLGGGGRENSDVWDTATNEIPPEVGESPECQWCPICRAARRMRDSGPGIGGQLSGAGDVVASAVQDAIGALDSLLAKASGTGAGRDSAPRSGSSEDSAQRDGAARDRSQRDSADYRPPTSGPRVPDTAATGSSRDRPGLVGLPGGADSAGEESLPGGPVRANGSWPSSQATDRPGDARGAESDPWGAATEPAEAGHDTSADTGSDAPGDRSDGPGHEPDDRG